MEAGAPHAAAACSASPPRSRSGLSATGPPAHAPARPAQDKGVAREAGRHRQPAPGLPHHGRGRPGGACGGKRSKVHPGAVNEADAPSVVARGLGGRAPRTHICGDLAYVCVGASWSCARLLVDPRNRGDRRPLRRARKGRPAGQAGVRDALLPDPGHRGIPHGPRQRVRQRRDRPDARGPRHREVAVGKGPPPRQRRRRVGRRDTEGRARPP